MDTGVVITRLHMGAANMELCQRAANLWFTAPKSEFFYTNGLQNEFFFLLQELLQNLNWLTHHWKCKLPKSDMCWAHAAFFRNKFSVANIGKLLGLRHHVIGHFRHSCPCQAVLEKYTKEIGLLKTKLKQIFPWGDSTFMMVKSLIEMKGTLHLAAMNAENNYLFISNIPQGSEALQRG